MANTEGKIVVCPQCGKKFKLKAGFDAASFTCSACGATVWVKKKPSAAPVVGGKRRGAARGAGKAAARGRGGRRKTTAARGRRGREPAAEEGGEAEGRYARGRYAKKDNTATIFLAIAGVVLVGLVIVFVATRGGGEKDQQAQLPDVTDGTGEGTKPDGEPGQPRAQPGKAPVDGDLVIDKPDQPAGSADTGKVAEKTIPEVDQGKEAASGPAKKLGGSGSKKSGKGKSRWDPPADLAHLENTTPEMRKKIDSLVTTMFDWEMGRDSLDAKEALVAIGKPAFPRILGAMAKLRDTITDVDSQDERMLESSLKLADEALREMDGWLTAKGKSTLRPGSEKKYIAYICRLHYKRWMQTLQNMPEMPGPYDPSQEYEGEAEEYRGGN